MKKRPLFPPGVSRMTDIADAMRELRAKRETQGQQGNVMKTLIVSGKVSDMCDYRVEDAQGTALLEHDGYVPHNLSIGGGDYIRFAIDIETGTIVGWNAQKVKEAIQRQIDGDEE